MFSGGPLVGRLQVQLWPFPPVCWRAGHWSPHGGFELAPLCEFVNGTVIVEHFWPSKNVVKYNRSTHLLPSLPVCYDSHLTEGLFRTLNHLCNHFSRPCTIFISIEKRWGYWFHRFIQTIDDETSKTELTWFHFLMFWVRTCFECVLFWIMSQLCSALLD